MVHAVNTLYHEKNKKTIEMEEFSMEVILEEMLEEKANTANAIENRELDNKNPQDTKYVSEKDLRKVTEILSNLFQKNSKHKIFGYMKDIELSVFIDRILSK